MSARRTRFHSVLAALVVACLAWGACSDARADDLDDAETLAAAGQRAEARSALAAWFADEAPAEASDLLRAAQLARALPDIELLRTVRARAEAVEAEAGSSSPALDLALGFAYLGLAEENLRLRTTSRSISLYFADALTRAKAVPADGPHGETAARLAAGVRFAQGDLAAAVEGLDAFRAATDDVTPRFEALHGRLTYEKAAAMPVTASGHAGEEAQALLQRAAASLAVAASSKDLSAAQRRAASLRQAYALHRLGAIDAGEQAYRAAFGGTAREQGLVVRGLQSLLARDAARVVGVLEDLAKAHGDPVPVLDALTEIHRRAGDAGAVLVVAERRLASAPKDPLSWFASGRALVEAGVPTRALEQFLQGLRLDPNNLYCSFQVEQIARSVLADDPAGACAVYERLIALRPDDPYTRNNYGFILRDLVSAHTEKLKGGLERIPADAPEGTHARLKRCVEVYAEAVARIDPAKDSELDEATAWNLAGIINDYGLIVHYFVDVQDAQLAERQYLRALAMTDYGFKDTYAPNLQRLYHYVLTDLDHAWRWYRIAREAQHTIMAEAPDGRGGVALVPDEQKREAARRDVIGVRARILQALAMDAKEDGLPWPPAEENGNDR